jgi:hypothetical protein
VYNFAPVIVIFLKETVGGRWPLLGDKRRKRFLDNRAGCDRATVPSHRGSLAGCEFAVGGATDGWTRQDVKGDIGLWLTFCALLRCRRLLLSLSHRLPSGAFLSRVL